jgi:hypothetical protein
MTFWTGPHFLVSTRVSAQYNLDLGNSTSGRWVYSKITEGLFCEMCGRSGIGHREPPDHLWTARIRFLLQTNRYTPVLISAMRWRSNDRDFIKRDVIQFAQIRSNGRK